MQKSAYYFYSIVLLSFLSACSSVDPIPNLPSQNKTFDYETVASNVPYAKVAQLSHITPDKTLQYGALNEQFIYVWEGAKHVSSQTNIKPSPIVFIHGGCWLQDYDISHSLPLTSALSQQGFDVYSIEYRRTGNGGEWPVALQDIEQAFRHIQTLLQKSTPVKLLGHSAGGHLASLAAAKQSDPNFPIHLFGLAPIIDLPAYSEGDNSCQTATPRFMQGSQKMEEQAYKNANPLNFDLSSLSRAVFMVGDADAIVPANMASHPDGKNMLIEGAGHFDWIHPGSSSFKLLLEELMRTPNND